MAFKKHGKSVRDKNKNKGDKGDWTVIKTFKDGAALFRSGMLRTGIVRLQFVNFVTPKTNEDDDGNERESYGCAALIPPGAERAPYDMACKRFGESLGAETYRKLKRKNPLREQDEKVDDYDGFEEGGLFFNTTTKFKPTVTGRNKEEIDVSQFYSGCYARLTLRPYAYGVGNDRKKTKGNSGIGLGIYAVQFIRDGDPLGGGGADTDSAFEDEGEDDGMMDTEGEDENEFV